MKKRNIRKRASVSRKKKESATLINVYQLKIILMNIEPPIWRRFIVPDSMSLHSLHQVFQIVMGWNDSHLHQFVLGADIYADPESEPDGEMGKMKNEHQFHLGELLPIESTAITYEYDFGDGWKHLVLVEKISASGQADRGRLICLDGERACPPEDCGGCHGYAEVLEIIFNPSHPDYEAMLDWTGKDFNPEVFDIQNVNARLKELES